MKRHEWWFLIAIVLLYAATVAGFTVMITNFDDHKRLDRHACELSLANRLILHDLVRSAAADAATPPGIKDAFQRADHRLNKLIVQSTNCAHD